MKKILLSAVFLAASFTMTAQVGVGTTNPNASAALDVESTTKGFLMPRVTTAQRTAIDSPATGLQVYDTETKSLWVYDGTNWIENIPGKWDTIDFVDGDGDNVSETVLKDALVNNDSIGYNSTKRFFRFKAPDDSKGVTIDINENTDRPNIFAISKEVEKTQQVFNLAAVSSSTDPVRLHTAGLVQYTKVTTKDSDIDQNTLRVSSIIRAATNDTGRNRGLDISGFLQGPGAISRYVGADNRMQIALDANVTDFYNYQSTYTLNLGGSVNNLYNYHVREGFHSSTAGTVSNLYGVYVENVRRGTNLNYAIYTNQGKVRFGDDVETTGTLKVAGLPEHADNTAATGAGLTVGDFYRTADGTVKVVF